MEVIFYTTQFLSFSILSFFLYWKMFLCLISTKFFFEIRWIFLIHFSRSCRPPFVHPFILILVLGLWPGALFWVEYYGKCVVQIIAFFYKSTKEWNWHKICHQNEIYHICNLKLYHKLWCTIFYIQQYIDNYVKKVKGEF